MSDTDRGEARRQQVLDAAAECFHKNGFHGASMAQIAKTAGMSPGHIYNLFENKDDIIATIVERDQAERLAVVDAMRREDDVVRAMIDQVECGVERQFNAPRAGLLLEVLAEAGRNPKLAEVVRRADAIARERLMDLLQTALAQRGRDCDPADVRARAEVMMALFEGLTVRGLRNPGVAREAIAPIVSRLVEVLID